MLGLLDLRSLGYYKVKQSILQQNLSKYYRFELPEVLCKQFSKFINTPKKEKKGETREKYPWFDPSDERKYITDREILKKMHRFQKILFKRQREKGSKGYAIQM